MRMLCLPVALMLALSLTACKQTQTKTKQNAADPSVASSSLPVAGKGDVQPPDMRTPEQKKAEAQLKAAKQPMINALNNVLMDLDKQGIKVKKTPQKKPWRLIVPALQKVSDPAARQAQATEIAESFRSKIEKIMERSIDVDVYADDKETQKLN